MSHFSGHFEGASTFLTPKLSLAALGTSLGPLKMSLEMAHKVIVLQKKIMSRSFLNSETLKVRTVSILFDLLSSKKVAPPLIRVEKKFLQNSLKRVYKEAEFCTDFKNVQKS
jgi:hypothetical protein